MGIAKEDYPTHRRRQMTLWGWIGFAIVLALAVTALGAVVACCMLSSRISRDEER